MRDFSAFREMVEARLWRHPVITENPYTRWFAGGSASDSDIRDLILQFSVFSNHFLVIQAKRMVNAATEESERQARHILMNECGVGMDPATGSAEGRTFSTRAAHINWLRELGAALGMEPRSLGRWESGSPATRAFLDGLDRSYGSRDGRIGAGASFAIENWAAFGIGDAKLEPRNFWKELIVGLEEHNRNARAPRGLEPLPLGFFQYHFQLESGHGANVWRELESSCDEPDFDPEVFLEGGSQALDSILTFWLGLDDTRRQGPARAARPAVAAGAWPLETVAGQWGY